MELTSYGIRAAAPSDVADMVRIYNSNPSFLIHHLGFRQVDEGFLRRGQALRRGDDGKSIEKGKYR